MTFINELVGSLKEVFTNDAGKLNLWGKFVISILIAFLSYIIVALFDKLVNDKLMKEKKISEGNSRIRTAASIINSFVRIFVYSFAVLAILDFIGVNTRSILAVAGIGGITIAFAAQSIVKDVINGMFLLFENQFDIGDWIGIQGKEGTVIDIGLRTIKLQDIAGQIHMIPNGQIDIVTNYSKNNMKAIADISLRAHVDLDKAWELIDESLGKLKEKHAIFLTRPIIFGLMKADEYSYTIRVNAITKVGDQWLAERIIRKELLRELQKENMLTVSSVDPGEIKSNRNGKI
ncbi:MAG: mechanosensitive ion channel family protein [Tissierellia bacterium]|nr:mechanosensitive ion channel family protein [Tissierellia bacterium]